MNQAANWLGLVEEELHEYYQIPEQLRILQDRLDNLPINITTNYSPKYAQHQKSRNNRTETLAVKRLEIIKEIQELKSHQKQIKQMLNQMSEPQQEILLRCYGQRQSLRRAAKAMQIPFSEARQIGYQAMRYVYENG